MTDVGKMRARYRRITRFARQHHEPRRVVGRILHPVLHDVEAVQIRRQRRSNRRNARFAAFRHQCGCPGSVGIGERYDPARPQKLAALTQCLWMAIGGAEFARRIGRWQRHQRVVDRHEMFGHNRQAAIGQQKVDIRHAPMLRIFNRDNRRIRAPARYSFQRIFERKTRQRQASGRKF